MTIQLAERTKGIQASQIRAMFAHAMGVPDLISLGIGEPDYDTPKHIVEACCQALHDGFTHYSPSAGEIFLLRALAEKLKTRNHIDVTPQEIIVTIGGQEALTLSMLAAINPGDEVLIPDPCFFPYGQCVRFAEGEPVFVPTYEENGFRLLAKDVEKLITPKTKAILINSPANPTGAVMTREDLEGLAALAIKHDLIVMSDEVYEEFTYEGEHISIASLQGMKERTFTLNSFSKTYAMTGWRIGYIAGPQAAIEAMTRIHGTYLTNVAAFVQKGAEAALTGPVEPLQEMIESYSRRRRLIVDGLNSIPGIECPEPQGAFYVFPNIKALGKNSYDLAVDMIQKVGVLTIPGSVFGKQGEGYLRMSYATAEDKIKEAIERIREYVSKL
jgi:aminotransferase